MYYIIVRLHSNTVSVFTCLTCVTLRNTQVIQFPYLVPGPAGDLQWSICVDTWSIFNVPFAQFVSYFTQRMSLLIGKGCALTFNIYFRSYQTPLKKSVSGPYILSISPYLAHTKYKECKSVKGVQWPWTKFPGQRWRS